jgi:hypothetical protein
MASKMPIDNNCTNLIWLLKDAVIANIRTIFSNIKLMITWK